MTDKSEIEVGEAAARAPRLEPWTAHELQLINSVFTDVATDAAESEDQDRNAEAPMLRELARKAGVAAARSALPPPQRGAWANRLWEHGLNRETADLLGARIEEAIIGAALPRVPEPDLIDRELKRLADKFDYYVVTHASQCGAWHAQDRHKLLADCSCGLARALDIVREAVRAARAGAEAPPALLARLHAAWTACLYQLGDWRKETGYRTESSRQIDAEVKATLARVSPPEAPQ